MNVFLIGKKLAKLPEYLTSLVPRYTKFIHSKTYRNWNEIILWCINSHSILLCIHLASSTDRPLSAMFRESHLFPSTESPLQSYETCVHSNEHYLSFISFCLYKIARELILQCKSGDGLEAGDAPQWNWLECALTWASPLYCRILNVILKEIDSLGPWHRKTNGAHG